MKCQHCGAELVLGARFCWSCGSAQPHSAPPSLPETSPASAPPPARKKRSCGCLVGLGLLLAAVALLCVAALGGAWYFEPELRAAIEPYLPEITVNEPVPARAAADRQTARIGAQGGELTCAAGARVVFPPDVLQAEVEVAMDTRVSAPALPAAYLASPAGFPVDISVPPDTPISGMIELILPLQRQPDTATDLYTVFQWDGAGWSDIGGLVEGDQIRVQVNHFSTFQPVLAYQPRRPVGFTNHGPYNATVRPWTYVPADANTPAPPPTASTASFAPGAPGGWPNPSRFLSLPLGSYTFCVDWTDGRDADGDGTFDYFHTVTTPVESLTVNDPDSTSLAREIDIDTEGGRPGACGPAPLLVAGAATGPADGPEEFDYGSLPRRPVGFVNHGPFNAGVRAQTYVPAGLDRPVPPPLASTASFAPGGGGLWPNSSRFLALPIGAYTFCIDWTDGQDEDEDGYFDYYHFITREPFALTANDPESLDLARQIDFNTEGGAAGPCNPFGGEGGDTVELPPGAGDVTVRLTWSTIDDLDLHVFEPGGSEIFYSNPRGGQGGRLDRDANPGCGEATRNPIENIFWPSGEAPDGEYTVRVVYYADCDAFAQVQFRLRIMVDERVVFDRTEQLSAQGDAFEFTFER